MFIYKMLIQWAFRLVGSHQLNSCSENNWLWNQTVAALASWNTIEPHFLANSSFSMSTRSRYILLDTPKMCSKMVQFEPKSDKIV